MTLAGRSIVVCRATHQAGPLLDRLTELGADPLHVPLIEVVPPADGGLELRLLLLGVTAEEWICLTSTNAVDAVDTALGGGAPVGRIAVIGGATADRVRELGWPIDAIAGRATAAGLGETLPARPGDRAIAPVAELASTELADALRSRGIEIDVVTAYRTIAPEVTASELDRISASDVVLVTSPSIVHRLAARLPIDALPPLVAIGPTTAAAIEAEGGAVSEVAEETSVDGLIEAALRTLGP